VTTASTPSQVDAPGHLQAAIEVGDLHVWRGEAHVLHGVSLAVPERRVTALMGRNGVGKTTLLLAIMGLLPARGSVRMGDAELVGMPTHRIAQRGIGYVPEDREVFASLTVAENLRLAELPGGAPRYDHVLGLFPDLAGRMSQVAGTLSGGQQQMLSLARALLEPRSVLLIDEPTKGLAPIVVEHVVEALRRATADTTVLLVEQNLWVAEQLARDVVVLDQGAVTYRGAMRDLADDPLLAGRHLGVEVR
jgi:branched-chain amino acid transport system ATP-binding protein